MPKLIDPAQDEPDRQKRKEMRLQAWKRPAKQADRDKLRADRITYAREVYGYGNSVSE